MEITSAFFPLLLEEVPPEPEDTPPPFSPLVGELPHAIKRLLVTAITRRIAKERADIFFLLKPVHGI
jgi:hypothetical protein